MIAVAVVVLPHFVRLTRASVVSETARDYVTSARVAGARLPRLMFVTVLPNCMAPLIVQATLSFSTAILDAAALGFLGQGAQPPTPERSEEHTSELQSLMRISYAVFCLQKKKHT